MTFVVLLTFAVEWRYLRKLFSATLTYVLKVIDLNRDLATVASNHSGATCTSIDSNRDLTKVVNAQFSLSATDY